MAKSVIIIGAGVGGLSAGCYAQMNGYQSQIFEMHDKPGGLCTAWRRKDYTIDGCIHWLVGTSPGSTYSFLWDELGILEGKQVVNFDRISTFEGAGGRKVSIFADPDRFREHLLEVAPEDRDLISDMAKTVRRLVGFVIPSEKALEVSGPLDKLANWAHMSRRLPELNRWRKLTMADLALRFKSPVLREAFQLVLPESSALAYLFTLAWMYEKSAGYVIGGSEGISSSLESRYLGLGGKTTYRAAVKKILIEKGRATGVELEDGSKHEADVVISAADGHGTIFEMLDGLYVNERIRTLYSNLPIFEPIVYVALGVNDGIKDLPAVALGNFFRLDKPFSVGGIEHRHLMVSTHNYDPTLAPRGKSVIVCMMESRLAFWEELRREMPAYKSMKSQIAELLISQLDGRFPGLRSKVEIIDVATPATFRRYTGNWRASYEGFLLTPTTLNMRIPQTLPGLDNFYMAGQWVQPGGGIPGAALTARWAIQMLCRKERRRFTASVP